ncbi:hypothetical protein N9839_00875 [Flavobacteriaceae bacterium]|nr:hypothetical protein [Flavobacteriaceae bacterium]
MGEGGNSGILYHVKKGGGVMHLMKPLQNTN